MMHYGSWLQQGALDNNRYYKRCADESREEDSEPTSATPATSCERSSSADMFRLEFAATQCSKLVSNAEGLFNKLVINNLLPHNELDQIERWLCLKQEYEECVASDETASLQGFHENPRRSLERIEEVTETDERTDESASRGKPLRDSGGLGEASEEEEEDGDSEEDEDDEEEEEEERSDAGSDNPDFSEKLEEYMTRLKAQTDGMIDGRTGFPEIVLANRNDNYNNNTDRNNSSNNNNNNNNNINNDYVPIIKPIPIRNPSTRRNSMLPGSDMCREALTFNGGFRPCRNGNRETSTAEETPISRRRLLAAETDRRGSEEKRPEEAPTSSRDADTWRTRIPRFSEAPRKSKISRGKDGKPEADAELRSTRNRPAARIEKASGRQQEAPAFGQSGKDTATRRDKRLADDSGGKVAELESSRRRGGKTSDRRSRRKTAAREEDEEEEEDRESREDAERRRRLGERSESEDETRTSSPAPLRSRSSEVGSEEDVRRNAGTRHPERAVEEKVASPEGREEDDGEKEALRRDIRSLRKTRECLIEAKCSLDEKLQKERVLGTAEDRALSACGESIDVVDAIIEHKNEIMCGREAFDPRRWRRDKCETMSGQLEKLSGGEILTLFYKYFFKVIDLKETSKKLDAQTGQLERQLEIRDKRVLALSEALRRTKLEAERKFMELQREHQEKLHAVFRHLAEEGAAAGPSGHDAAIGAGCELARFKRENKLLRRRLADAEALVEPSGSGVPAPRGKTTAGKNLIGPPRTVQRQLEKSTPKTRVTREGNKLIIQQTLDSERRK